ncbi:hypothetical protein NSQ82_02815 [Caldifermentibacillus hisashii]|uniref:hypothetical protein n=1 Tax=Caldifermentibacillus hisashii TaxID=996558 RepID=UPI0031B6A260
MVTRTDLVAKNKRFSLKNGDEIGARRQKIEFPASKRRRKRVSSPKKSVSHRKMVTKTSLVVKNKLFSTKSGDENEAHRQKQAFLTEKWRREPGSSSKTSVSLPKVATKTCLVAKNKLFTPQNGDENRSRRQKHAFPTEKR